MPTRGGGPRRPQEPPASRKGLDDPARPRDATRLEIAVAARPALFSEILSNQLDAQPTLRVVGRAGDEGEIRSMIVKLSPRVLVFDYEGLGPNPEGTVLRLRASAPRTRILVLASRSSDETVEKILRAGASGLVGKQLAFTVLVRAIHAVAGGEIWADRRITSLALEALAGRPGNANILLTKREQEIADACSQGLRNKEIASLLNIRTKTVKGHLNHIFRKLQVDNRFAVGIHVIRRTDPNT